MSYESPIKLIKTLDNEMQMSFDNQILKAIQKVGIDVSKDELIKALEYDRRQYQKGYEDGKQDATTQWIPVSERLPDIGERVLISKVNGHIDIDYVDEEKHWHWVFDDWVVAWKPLPEPYKESDK